MISDLTSEQCELLQALEMHDRAYLIHLLELARQTIVQRPGKGYYIAQIMSNLKAPGIQETLIGSGAAKAEWFLPKEAP
jgi:hypothetical protein